MNETEAVNFAPPSAPDNAATITLWDSTVALGAGRMRLTRMTMLEILFVRHATNASAASGLVPNTSDDLGVNWRGMDFKDSAGAATMPATVAALAAGANKLYSFVVNNINDFQVLYTAGATAPTTWQVVITGIFGGLAVQK